MNKKILLSLDNDLYNILKIEAGHHCLDFSGYLREIINKRNKLYLSELDLINLYDSSKDINKLAATLKGLKLDCRMIEDVLKQNFDKREDDILKFFKDLNEFLKK